MGENSDVPPPTRIPLVVLGCGGVGLAFLSQIITSRSHHLKLGIHLHVACITDSSASLLSKEEASDLNDDIVSKIIEHKKLGLPLSSFDSPEVSYNPPLKDGSSFKVSNFFKNHQFVLVDVTNTDTEFVLIHFLSKGNCAVIANKKPITSSLDNYELIASANRRFKCESTVGAGLPVIASLERFKFSGDRISRITGALSGTLGYVMTELQKNRNFSEIVTEARGLGYTEPDPRDDLSGLDVARKALIMARRLGLKLSLENIAIESLFPIELNQEKMELEKFLQVGLISLDQKIKSQIDQAKSRQCFLRYVANLDFQSNVFRVGLEQVPQDSPLGRLQGTDNLVEIFSECYEKSPFVIQGAGAGNKTTAAGVLADVLELQEYFFS